MNPCISSLFRSGGLALAALACLGLGATGVAFAANELSNPSFETPDASGGDVNNAPGAPWVGFNDPNVRFTTTAFAHSGSQSVKTFGPFDFVGGGVGGFQKIPAMPSANYEASIWALNSSTDAIQGADFGVFKLEFFDAGMGFVGGSPVLGFNVFESPQITAATPQDQWTELGISAVSPPGTAFVQAVLVKVQLGNPFNGGSIFWDDASVMKVVPEPSSVVLALLGGLGVLGIRRKTVSSH